MELSTKQATLDGNELDGDSYDALTLSRVGKNAVLKVQIHNKNTDHPY